MNTKLLKIFSIKNTIFLLCAGFLFFGSGISSVYAACHVVTPTGSGTKSGADWNNALDKTLLSSGTNNIYVRGDTYYLATGAYDKVIVRVADSGTSVVTIKGAIAGDHCTDTGWSSGLSVENGPAVFNPTGFVGYSANTLVVLRSNYVTLDGNYRASPTGPYGFKVNNASPNGVIEALDGAGFSGTA